jgi:hypothetical protein
MNMRIISIPDGMALDLTEEKFLLTVSNVLSHSTVDDDIITILDRLSVKKYQLHHNVSSKYNEFFDEHGPEVNYDMLISGFTSNALVA